MPETLSLISSLIAAVLTESCKQKPPRITGVAHIFAAGRYSLAGLARMTKETAFRHEILMGLVYLGLMIWAGAQAWHYAVLGVLFFVLLAVETLNTSIEVVVDHISPNWSEMARDAKDLGSAAVFCLLTAISLFTAYVVFLA